MSIRILIADREEMFREVLRFLLESDPEFSVVGDTDDGQKLVRLTASLKPDVILLGLNLRGISGIEALREIATLNADSRPIVLVEEIENDDFIQALISGAYGVVCKSEPSQLLFKSIRSVAAGEYWASHSSIGELVRTLRLLTSAVKRSSGTKTGSLSCQQQQIVEAIIAGCSNKEIAQELSVSERTVKYHLTRIFSKLGVSGRMQLARLSLDKDASAAL
jgi:two-component system nitrate/nitrite response regulator NarL